MHNGSGKRYADRRAWFPAAALLMASAFPATTSVSAAELYAQAIGQPPARREAPPAPPPEEPAEPRVVEPAPPPETTAQTETPEGSLRTRILIGAGVAAALAALGGGGGGGGGDAAPASTSLTSP